MRGQGSIYGAPKGSGFKAMAIHWARTIKHWVIKHKSLALTLLVVIILASLVLIIWANNRADDTPKQLSPVAAEYKAQLPDLKQKVSDTPDDAPARKNYAIALYASGDINEAAKQYEEAVKLNSKDATAYNNLGNAYRDLNKSDQAIDAYKKSIELDRKSVNTYANLANVQLYTKDAPQDAINTYKNGLKELPENDQIELLLAIAYEQASDTQNAVATYKRILARDSDNKAAQANLDRIIK